MNPIESVFGTTKLSTWKSKKRLSSQDMLHMMFELEKTKRI